MKACAGRPSRGYERLSSSGAGREAVRVPTLSTRLSTCWEVDSREPGRMPRSI